MVKKLLPFFFQGNRYQQVLFLFFIFLSLPLQLIEEPGVGLGQSWRISINLALKNHLQWGSDYVFTFGPLGYLYTRVAAFVPQWHIIAFSLFVWANILFIARYFIFSSKIQDKVQLLTGAIVALMFSHVIKIEITSTVVCIIIFNLLYSIKHNSALSLAIAIIFSALNLFIKLNYFFPLLVIFSLYYFTIGIAGKKGEIRKYLLPGFLLQLLLVYLITFLYKIDISGYIKAGWYLANSYNDAMFKPVFEESIISDLFYIINPHFNTTLISLFILSLSVLLTLPVIIVIWKNRNAILFNPLTFLAVLFSLLFLFISFKFAFVRHGGLTYLYPPVPIFIFGILISFSGWRVANSKRYLNAFVILAFIPACLIGNTRMMMAENYSYSFVVKKIRQGYQRYISEGHISKTESKRTASIYYLPTEIKAKIGNSTVDIVPQEIAIAYFNDLTYHPRPVVQSYAAYNKYLDDLNYTKYVSSTAPEYLIYRNETIDNRYHFFDEARTKLAIRQRYVVVDSFAGNLLLKRADTIKQVLIGERHSKIIELNKFYSLAEDDSLTYATFDIKYSKTGRLMRFLFQPPMLEITFILDDGRSVNHRLILSTLQNPVLLSSYIESSTDSRNYFSGSGEPGKRIKQLKISAPSWAYEKNIHLQIMDIDIK